jgi:hypothetical protein
MTDWIITIPRTYDWLDYAAELARAKFGEETLYYRVPFIPKDLEVGDRCFVTWKDGVRGWMTICNWEKDLPSFKCTTTGKEWPEGNYIMRRGAFHPAKKDFVYKGFRGIRRFPEGEKLCPKE